MQVRQSAAETAIWTNSSSFSSTNGNWAPGPSATKQRNKGAEMHGRSHEHPVRPAASSVLSIVHNGSMINEIATVRQPEETQLTLFCDSIGGSFIHLLLFSCSQRFHYSSFYYFLGLFQLAVHHLLSPFFSLLFALIEPRQAHELISIFIVSYLFLFSTGRPRSIVKWYRLEQWEQSNFSAVQLYGQVQATG